MSASRTHQDQPEPLAHVRASQILDAQTRLLYITLPPRYLNWARSKPTRRPVVALTKMRPVAVIQHDAVQGPGMLKALLTQWGIPMVHIQPSQGDPIPRSASRFSGIALLGSDHSIHDPIRWICEERHLVQDALSQDVPVLGHCFGAQMLASVAGASVRRLPRPDIGWRMLKPTPYAHGLLGTCQAVPSFNWHHETFDIPAGAERILIGQHCQNKGFRVGPHLALQCHLEITTDILTAWCQHGAPELACHNSPSVQPASQILSDAPVWLPALHALARRVYGDWTAHLPESPMASRHHMPHRLDTFLMRSSAHFEEQERARHVSRTRTPRPR